MVEEIEYIRGTNIPITWTEQANGSRDYYDAYWKDKTKHHIQTWTSVDKVSVNGKYVKMKKGLIIDYKDGNDIMRKKKLLEWHYNPRTRMYSHICECLD